MPLAYSQNLIQFISGFQADYDNPSASSLPIGWVSFHQTGTSAGSGGTGFINVRFDRCESTINNPAGTIPLPNGTKYDPHQIYDVPKVPGSVSVYVWLIPAAELIAASSTTLNRTESAIMAFYAGASALVGFRGTLSGRHAYHDDTQKLATATARLVGLDANWNPPKQVPVPWGPGVHQTKGLEAVNVKFTFDLLTNWEWDVYG